MSSTSIKIDFSSRYIFGNKKTDFSVEFGTCPLMQFAEKITTPKCQGCYAALNLAIRASLRKKIQTLPPQTDEELDKFRKDMSIIKALGINRLRFYSWSDFRGPRDIDFVRAAVDAGLEVHILSKLLTVKKNEKHLIELFNMPGVVVSLSFNTDWMKDLDRIIALLEKHEPNNVQINYTLNPRKEKTDINWLLETFQVIHLKNDLKRKTIEDFNIPETQACGVFGRNGERVQKGGTCQSCNNCNLSYSAFKKGATAKLPEALNA